MKLLYYGENPTNPTGFGQMSHQILKALAETGHTIEVVATSVVEGQIDTSSFPYAFFPCPPGAEDLRNSPLIEDKLKNDDHDIFFYMGDFGANDDVFVWLGEARTKRPDLLSIAYCPLDCDILIPEAFSYMACVNVPVVYTEHAKRRIEFYRPELKGQISVIYPGCEPDVFYPLSPEDRRAARKDLFSIEDDETFLVVNVNRNQLRKDLARTMVCFHEFHKRHPNSILYLHSVQNDLGGSLPITALTAGLNVTGEGGDREIMFTPPTFSLGNPFSRADLNRVYNAADLLISTSTGEGWGLATSEAFSAGTPVLVPGNTANLDIVGEDEERGYLIKTGGDIDHLIWLYGKAYNPRDIVHAQDCVDKLEYIYSHREEAYHKAQVAQRWTFEHTWKAQGRKWQQLLTTLEQHLSPESPDKMVAI